MTKAQTRSLGAAAAALATAAVLAACGGGSSGGSSGGASHPASSAAAAGGDRGGFGAGGGQFPGAFGIAAAVTPGRIEVQNPSTGQTTVTYSGTTSFTRTATVSESAIAAGSCITAVAAGGSSSGPPAGSARTITATTVVISRPLNGSCDRFAGAGRPPRPRPSGTPSRSRAPGAGFGSAVSGTVTSVTGPTIDVRTLDRQSGATVTDTVDVDSATTYTEAVAASPADLKVGVCVQATGSADQTGTISAERIGISPSVNGSCTTGLGGRGGRFGPAGGRSTANG